MVNGGQRGPDEKAPGRAYLRKKPTYRRPSAKGADHGDGLDGGPLDKGIPYAVPEDGHGWPTTKPAPPPQSSIKPASRNHNQGEQLSPDPARSSGGIGKWVRARAVPLAFVPILALGGMVAYHATFSTPLTPTVIADASSRPSLLDGGLAGPELLAKTDEALGTFAPVEYSGSGNETLQLPEGVRNAVLVFPLSSSISGWTARDGAGEIVDRGGYFTTGSAELLMSEPDKSPTTLDVEGSGAWTVQLWPFSSLPVLPQSGSAHSDTREKCFLYAGPGGTAKISYEGGDYFNLNERTAAKMNWLLSTNGQVEATRTLSPGPTALCLTLFEGSWAITAP